MKIFTVLTHRSPADLAQFVRLAQAAGATGVTVFTSPALVAFTPPPGTPTPQYYQQQADEAAARKDYRLAAEFQQKADNARQDLRDRQAEGANWIKEATTPIHQITQLVVLGSNVWSPDSPFTASAFLARIEHISNILLSNGIGGIKQTTPLLERTYIPVHDTNLVGGGEAPAVAPTASVGAPAQPAAAAAHPATPPTTTPPTTTPPPGRHPADHPDLPKTLSPRQSQYAAMRLGLDRGGVPRGKTESSNLIGVSPAAGGKIEAEIVRVWPQFQAKLDAKAEDPALA